MKLTLRWLQEFVDLPTTDPRAVADSLENLGYEVESIESVEAAFHGVVIGKVLEIAPHPNANKIRVCQVDAGESIAEIVCGAWNFEPGAIVPVALPGAVLGGDFEIGRREIRGVVSNGMICSEKELGLGDDADGIMVLDGEFPGAADRLGDDLASVLDLGDVAMEIEVNPNRPDCMSVIGLARELAAHFGTELRTPKVRVPEGGPKTGVVVTVEDTEACPRFVAREVSGISVGPSPLWMRSRLQASGVRPIANVVDASNYAMLELGHPTHAFDAERLGDDIVVRRARTGETVTTLDGEERALIPDDIVIADADKPVGIAGVMGGASTEVHTGTTRVVVESAYWDPPSILATSKRLGLRSEASARFERGMDPNFCDVAADRVVELLVEIAGGTAAGDRVDVYPTPIEPSVISLPLAEIPRNLGLRIDRKTIAEILTTTGFGVSGSDPIRVEVPTRRPDVTRTIDLVEDVARLYGYARFPESVATGFGGGLPDSDERLRRLRHTLVGAGYHETLLYSFVGMGDLDALGLSMSDPRREGIRVVNPLREEEGVLRTTLLPALLKAAGANAGRHIRSVALFETGKVFLPGTGKLPDQPDHLGFVAVGIAAQDWAAEGRSFDIRDAVGLWELIAREMRIPNATVAATSPAPFHPGRAAETIIGDTPVGVVGEVHPRVAAAFGMTDRVIAGEIDLTPLITSRDHWVFKPPSPYPPATFDLAFELAEDVPAAGVLAAIDSSAGPTLESRNIFDVFSGDPIPAGRKSLAVRLIFRHPDRTLADDDVAPIRRTIVEAVVAATGATLRGEL